MSILTVKTDRILKNSRIASITSEILEKINAIFTEEYEDVFKVGLENVENSDPITYTSVKALSLLPSRLIVEWEVDAQQKKVNGQWKKTKDGTKYKNSFMIDFDLAKIVSAYMINLKDECIDVKNEEKSTFRTYTNHFLKLVERIRKTTEAIENGTDADINPENENNETANESTEQFQSTKLVKAIKEYVERVNDVLTPLVQMTIDFPDEASEDDIEYSTIKYSFDRFSEYKDYENDFRVDNGTIMFMDVDFYENKYKVDSYELINLDGPFTLPSNKAKITSNSTIIAHAVKKQTEEENDNGK